MNFNFTDYVGATSNNINNLVLVLNYQCLKNLTRIQPGMLVNLNNSICFG